MEGSSIAEIRGVDSNQNLDHKIAGSGVLTEKLNEFPDGEKYLKKESDMKRLTEIDNKHQAGEELSAGDLKFLYQIDAKIDGFGYQSDPRIKELLKSRDARTDLAELFDCRPDQISLSEEESLSGDIQFHYGNLYLSSLTSAEGLILPTSIGGYLDLGSLTSAEDLILPTSIGGDLYLDRLTSAEGLEKITGVSCKISIPSALMQFVTDFPNYNQFVAV